MKPELFGEAIHAGFLGRYSFESFTLSRIRTMIAMTICPNPSARTQARVVGRNQLRINPLRTHTAVGEIDQHAEPVHLSDHFLAEIGEAAVARRLGRAVAQPYAEVVEGGKRIQAVLDRRAVFNRNEARNAPQPVRARAISDDRVAGINASG
jgi:hypothetical protein